MSEIEAGDFVAKHHPVVDIQLGPVVADIPLHFRDRPDAFRECAFPEMLVDAVDVNDLLPDHPGVVVDGGLRSRPISG